MGIIADLFSKIIQNVERKKKLFTFVLLLWKERGKSKKKIEEEEVG